MELIIFLSVFIVIALIAGGWALVQLHKSKHAL